MPLGPRLTPLSKAAGCLRAHQSSGPVCSPLLWLVGRQKSARRKAREARVVLSVDTMKQSINGLELLEMEVRRMELKL